MIGATNYPITVVELPQFERQAGKVFVGNELDSLIDFVAQTPDIGDIIQGSGGIRKLRWGAGSQGKRGGARVIYYFRDLNMPVFLIALYTKGEKIDLTQAELKIMRQLVGEIVDDYHALRHVLKVHQRPA